MSWTDELYQVYENNYGKESNGKPLLPKFHTTACAQIEVLLSEDGKLINASRIDDKADSVTIIQVTEDSGARSNTVAPHPLADKLFYLAGDYEVYAKAKEDAGKFYAAYMEQLQEWDASPNAHRAVHAIYRYLSKGTLMADLIKDGVLVADPDTGRLKDGKKVGGYPQEVAFVRFRINYQDLVETESRTWLDKSLYENYIQFYMGKLGNEQLCYATGTMQPCTYKHPSKILNDGDMARLISANDESGFTYRGRFCNKEEAFSIGFEYSQKIHSALRWLIRKQGIAIGSMTFLAWESGLKPLPTLLTNPLNTDTEEPSEALSDDDWDSFDDWELDQVADTLPAYKDQLRKAIWGSDSEITVRSKAMIMLLDETSPGQGRMAMTMYTELPLSELYKNIEKWHSDCAWMRYDWKDKRRKFNSFSLYEIAEYAFGIERENKKKQRIIECKQETKDNAVLRLIPCVTEGRRVPKDIVQNLVYKASRPQSYKSRSNWCRVLEIACGMIRKTMTEEQERKKKEGVIEVALNKQCKSRSYLYGRLLAAAEAAEASTYDKEKDKGRVTNAARYFESFATRPYQTWGIIYNRLIPYLNQMSPQTKVYYQKLFGEIMGQFEDDDFQNNSKLKPEFLLAYHCQLNDIYTKKTPENKEEN